MLLYMYVPTELIEALGTIVMKSTSTLLEFDNWGGGGGGAGTLYSEMLVGYSVVEFELILRYVQLHVILQAYTTCYMYVSICDTRK